MQSEFLKFMSTQQSRADQERKDALAQQQQNFVNIMAVAANKRAKAADERQAASSRITNSINNIKLNEANRLTRVRNVKTQMQDVLSNPNSTGITRQLDLKYIPTQLDKADAQASSNEFSLIPGAKPNQTVSTNAPSFPLTAVTRNGANANSNVNLANTLTNTLEKARNSTPESKALYAANADHITAQELTNSKSKAVQIAINAGATPAEAEVSANTIIGSLYGAKITQKDIQAKKDYNLKMFKALYPAKSGNNVTINTDGTISASNSKAGKNYKTIGYNDNFDPVDFSKQMQSYKQYMGTSSLFPDFKLFNSAHKAIVGDTPTSSIKYMEQGIAEANKQRKLMGLPNINTSSAVRIMAAMPKNERWFISNGFKNSKNLTQFGAAINLAANKFGSDNTGNSREKIYGNQNGTNGKSTIMLNQRNKAIKALQAKNSLLDSLVGTRANVGITGESTYNTSHLNRVLKSNPLHTIKNVNEIINLQMQDPGKFKQYIKQIQSVDPLSANTIIKTLQTNNSKRVNNFIELSKTPKGVQTIVDRLSTLDHKSAEYKYDMYMLSLGNTTTKALAKGSYSASTASTYNPAVDSYNPTTSKINSESSKKVAEAKKRAEAIKMAMYLKTHPLEAPMVESTKQHAERVKRIQTRFTDELKAQFDIFGTSNESYVKKQLSKYNMYLDVDKLYNSYKKQYQDLYNK